MNTELIPADMLGGTTNSHGFYLSLSVTVSLPLSPHLSLSLSVCLSLSLSLLLTACTVLQASTIPAAWLAL